MMFINKTNRTKIMYMLLAALIFRCMVVNAQQHLQQQELAEKIVRFHVIANSDTKEDQQIKYQVKDRVLTWLENKQDGFVLDIDKEELTDAANAVLIEAGCTYRARMQSGTFYFPERSYGEQTYPAGWYQAFLLKLGKAGGKNWWCAFYPELGFSDCIRLVLEEERKVDPKSELTIEAYDHLLHDPSKWKIRFRWLHYLFQYIS